MPLAFDTMERMPLLGAADSLALAERVMGLKDWWIQRHPEGPFYTLGMASYMDATSAEAHARYLAYAERLNPVIREAFGPLLQQVCDALAGRLGEPVQLAEHQALPGFHIFLAHQAFAQPVARIHCDLQHQLLDWGGTVPEDNLSFTLPVDLPATGGGMDVWPIEQADWLALAPPERKARLAETPSAPVPYDTGTLVLHSGRMLHRIAATPGIREGDRRITLQGHGARIDGHWHLYW